MICYLLLIFSLDYRNVTQKANSSKIFFSSKWIIKQQRQVTTLTIHLAQELVINAHCRSCTKDTRDLKMRAVAGIGNWQWPTDSITEPNPLTVIPDAAEELNIDHSMVILHWKQTGKVEKLHKCVPHNPAANKRVVLHCLLSFYATISKVDFIQLATTSSVLRPGSSSKAPPKDKLAPKNTFFLVVWCSFDPPQLSESRWKHYIWKVRSANCWDAGPSLQPVLVNRTGPLLHDNAQPHII